MENFAELMHRLLEIQSGARHRSPELIAEDERLMDGLQKRTQAGTEAKSSGILGIRDVANRLKIKTPALRALLRNINCKSPGQRYAWKASDPCLRSLPALIKAETAKRAGAAPSNRRPPTYPEQIGMD